MNINMMAAPQVASNPLLVAQCASLRHAHTRAPTHIHIYIHTHPPPPLSSSPVAMEPVAKAERFVVVMEVLDERRRRHDDDDGREDDNSDRVNSPFAELQGPTGHKPMHCWALLSATWVEGATRNTAQCKQTLSSPQNKPQPRFSIRSMRALPF